MKSSSRWILMLVLASLPVLSACGMQPTAPAAGSVPRELATIEAAAEDIIDFAPGGDWDKIQKDVNDIEAAWKSYEPQAKVDGAAQEAEALMNSALVELETAAEAQDASATMQGSNDVSAAVVELFALYNPVTPVDIGRLDVLERQVILDVAAGDYSKGLETMSRIRSVWEDVKSSVLAHDGSQAASDFEASLAVQEAALVAEQPQELTREASAGLELVDVLERLY